MNELETKILNILETKKTNKYFTKNWLWKKTLEIEPELINEPNKFEFAFSDLIKKNIIYESNQIIQRGLDKGEIKYTTISLEDAKKKRADKKFSIPLKDLYVVLKDCTPSGIRFFLEKYKPVWDFYLEFKDTSDEIYNYKPEKISKFSRDFYLKDLYKLLIQYQLTPSILDKMIRAKRKEWDFYLECIKIVEVNDNFHPAKYDRLRFENCYDEAKYVLEMNFNELSAYMEGLN